MPTISGHGDLHGGRIRLELLVFNNGEVTRKASGVQPSGVEGVDARASPSMNFVSGRMANIEVIRGVGVQKRPSSSECGTRVGPLAERFV